MNYSGIMTLPVSDTTPEMLVALADAMRGQVVDGVRVHYAVPKLVSGFDYGPLIHLYVVLDDPADGAETWLLETTWQVRHLADHQAELIGIQDDLLTSPVAVSDAAGVGLLPLTPGQ